VEFPRRFGLEVQMKMPIILENFTGQEQTAHLDTLLGSMGNPTTLEKSVAFK
jgi:hypothetical protein